MLFTMLFSPFLVGYQFKFVFNDNIGILNYALQAIGLCDGALPWLVVEFLANFAFFFSYLFMSS